MGLHRHIIIKVLTKEKKIEYTKKAERSYIQETLHKTIRIFLNKHFSPEENGRIYSKYGKKRLSTKKPILGKVVFQNWRNKPFPEKC